jgi:hypothetical protein
LGWSISASACRSASKRARTCRRGGLEELADVRLRREQLLDAAAQVGVATARLIQVRGAFPGLFLLQRGEEDGLDNVNGFHGSALEEWFPDAMRQTRVKPLTPSSFFQRPDSDGWESLNSA